VLKSCYNSSNVPNHLPLLKIIIGIEVTPKNHGDFEHHVAIAKTSDLRLIIGKEKFNTCLFKMTKSFMVFRKLFVLLDYLRCSVSYSTSRLSIIRRYQYIMPITAESSFNRLNKSRHNAIILKNCIFNQFEER
jgi:hypothetical protein